ncbi:MULTISPECIES: cytochrome C oxidase subunit II [unclassified Methylococcus]|uniref:cytochrome C oxidase subunit II n=1 Tax=unclassified Methylococcus TaxID=2618889 RepID=UPI003D7E71F3
MRIRFPDKQWFREKMAGLGGGMSRLEIDELERKWLSVSLAMIGLFVGAIVVTAVSQGLHPPSHVETIDSASLHLSQEFAEDKLGVQPTPLADGSLQVRLVVGRYGFYPREIEVPAGRRIVFRMASMDVLHGAHIPMTNMSTMIVPGYVSEVVSVFPKPGEYPMLCNEYCGLGHDHMWSKVTVIAQENWREPATGGKQP